MLLNLFHSGTVCNVADEILTLVNAGRIYFFCLLYEFWSSVARRCRDILIIFRKQFRFWKLFRELLNVFLLRGTDKFRGSLCRADNRRRRSLLPTTQVGRYNSAEGNNFSRVLDVIFSLSSNQSFRFAECEEIFPLIRIRDNFRLFYNQIEKNSL